MRTPLRLAATLLKFRIAGAFRGAKQDLPLRRIFVADEAQKAPAHAGDSAAGNNTIELPASPILWLGGSVDPLSSPVIGKFTRHLRAHGRAVFLETDGTQLRRRIHEFRPDGRLYHTVRLYGTPQTHDLRMQRDGAFALAMEGIRAAQLSGFLISAHVVVENGTQLSEINRLLRQLCAMNLDGMIITAEDDASHAQRETAIAARGLIGNPWWASFSRLAQRAFNEPHRGGVPAPFLRSRAVAAGAETPTGTAVGISHDAAVSGEEVAVQ